MIFEALDPRKGKQLQLLNEKGKLSKDADKYPLMSNDVALKALDILITARAADDWSVSLQRQGRMPTYPPNKGQEANTIGSLLALNNDDWFVPAFRELGGVLTRGIPLKNWYMYYYGNEEGNRLEIEKYHTLPQCVPIASQYLHSVGLAYAEKFKGSKRLAIAFVGDGGTSEGDFHEALNFAGVWNTANIFYIQNNQFAISVRREFQTASKTLAEKAFAYNIEGVQIDGNDMFAVYAATKMAADKARSGNGPTLIEGVTYRLGAHTTADDPTRYRQDDEVEKYLQFDPLIRLEKYLIDNKSIDENEIEKKKKEAKDYVTEEFKVVEDMKDHTLEDTYIYMYKEMPEILKMQMKSQMEFIKEVEK